jgi:hypothetical protein
MVPENAEPVYQLWSDEGFGGWTDTDKATYCWWLDSKNPPRMRKLYTAPVAAQPDVTQQTLNDVMAGIPARDAEIEALRKEIEVLKASAEPVAWVRRHPDGALTAEFLEHAVIEPVRRNSGAWVPLYTAPVAAQEQPAFNVLAHLQRQRQWSERTFGPGLRTAGVCDHIRKELREIEADPTDLREWVDVVILALDGAWRTGATPQQIIDAIVAKQVKNEGRVWPDWRTVDPNKAIEHDRSGEVQAQQPVSGADGVPKQTKWPVLKAMANNYVSGKHVWDHLDAEACAKGAEEIRQLRAALSQQDADKVDADQWVSVNERLPEIHEWRAGSIAGISDAVLTIDEDDLDTMTVQCLRKGGQGDLTTLYWDHGDSPTHWRPAPSLPGIDAARKEPGQ